MPVVDQLRSVLGSVADEVVRRSWRPVLLLRRPAPSETYPAGWDTTTRAGRVRSCSTRHASEEEPIIEGSSP